MAQPTFWSVSDVESTVDDRRARRDVRAVRRAVQDRRQGIARLGDEAVAWFKDPDGNILAVGT